jgi:hypothetical protein
MNPSSNIRKFLWGTLRTHLLDLLAEAKKSDVEIYAALYELGDPALVATLKQIGAKCSLVLGSGLCWPRLNPTQVLMNPLRRISLWSSHVAFDCKSAATRN